MKTVLVLLALASAGASAEPVTYRTAGATARQVIKQVGDRVGETWAVDNALAGEIIVVNINKIEPDVFRARLASALSGKWVRRDDGTLLLEDDAPESKRRHEAAQREFVLGVRARVDTMIADLEKVAFREGSLSTNELSGLQPLYILRQIDDSVLEKLGIGERVVLSTHPNRMQSRLPNVLPKLNEIGTERSRRMAETTKQEQPGAISITVSTPEVTSGLFVIERYGFEYLQLVYSFGSSVGSRAVRPPYHSFERKGVGSKIAWSGVAAELSRLYRVVSPSASHGVSAISSRTIEVLRNPVEHDPLSFAFGEGMLTYAEGRGLGLVACMPDDEFSWELAYATEGITTDDFLEKVRARPAITVKEEQGFLLVHPSDPLAAREFRGNREALKELIERSSSRMYPSLDMLAEMAAAHVPLWRTPVPFRHVFASVIGSDGGGISGFEYNPSTWRGLQLYHALTPSVRARMRNGEEVRIGTLALAAKDVLQRLLFGAPQSLFQEHPEPTVAMPNGLPADGRIRAEISTEPILTPLPDGGDFETPAAPLGPQAVARIRIDIERNEPTISLNRVRLGERVVWRFTVLASDGIILRKTAVCEDNVDPKGKVLTMSQLPEAVTKELAEAERIERIRMFGGG